MDSLNYSNKELGLDYEDMQEVLLDPKYIDNNFADQTSLEKKISGEEVKQIFNIVDISEDLKNPLKFLYQFAQTYVPRDFNGSPVEFAALIKSYYAEKLADNLLEYNLASNSNEVFKVQESLNKAHKLALISTYVNILEINKTSK